MDPPRLVYAGCAPVTADLRNELASELDQPEDDSGWSYVGPRIVVGDLRPALHLVAHIHSKGNQVSRTALHAWLGAWTVRVSATDAARRLDQLDRLGADWSAHRETFHRLLTTGVL